MGKYIETDSSKNKAQFLVKNNKATVTYKPVFDKTGDTVLVCVVDNGPFEAAAIAYSEQEMEAFNDPADYRPKTWLVMPRAEVIKLIPLVEKYLIKQ